MNEFEKMKEWKEVCEKSFEVKGGSIVRNSFFGGFSYEELMKLYSELPPALEGSE